VTNVVHRVEIQPSAAAQFVWSTVPAQDGTAFLRLDILTAVGALTFMLSQPDGKAVLDNGGLKLREATTGIPADHVRPSGLIVPTVGPVPNGGT
jgi:hypothetical protein